QFAIYITGAIIAASVLLNDLPGGWGEFLRLGQDARKFKLFDLSFDPTKPYTLWAGLFGGAFITMASHGADQLMVQRYFCARGQRRRHRAAIRPVPAARGRPVCGSAARARAGDARDEGRRGFRIVHRDPITAWPHRRAARRGDGLGDVVAVVVAE